MTIWQTERFDYLNAMMYNAALIKTRRSLRKQVPLENDADSESLPVLEKESTILKEWVQGWWLKKVSKLPVSQKMIDGMFGAKGANEKKEKNLYN